MVVLTKMEKEKTNVPTFLSIIMFLNDLRASAKVGKA